MSQALKATGWLSIGRICVVCGRFLSGLSTCLFLPPCYNSQGFFFSLCCSRVLHFLFLLQCFLVSSPSNILSHRGSFIITHHDTSSLITIHISSSTPLRLPQNRHSPQKPTRKTLTFITRHPRNPNSPHSRNRPKQAIHKPWHTAPDKTESSPAPI